MLPSFVTSHLAFRLEDEAATERLGLALGKGLNLGDQLALTGHLGAGKTTLCRFLAAGFGVDDLSQVASPTYAYAHTYPAGPKNLHHLDFYRLDHSESAYALGLDDVLADPQALCLIEWASRVPELIAPHALWLHLVRDPLREGRDGVLRVPTHRVDEIRAWWPDKIELTPTQGVDE